MSIERHGLVVSIRERYFYSWPATAASLLLGALFVVAAFYVGKWAFVDAVFRADVQACERAGGACWGFVAEKWRLIVFGRYPYELQWRPAAALILLTGLIVASCVPRWWTRRGFRALALLWALGLSVFFTLMSGGVFGLEKTSSDMWGGLPLTVMLTLFGMTLSIPLGIALALARRSNIALLRWLSAGYIEIVRGVPLITVLFVATFVFPLLMPVDASLSAFWRVALGIIFFQAAYLAETVRGGLQTVPKGQFEAAASLGLSSWGQIAYVILPQALLAVIPAFVNSLLSCFMDTSLVTIVSMYDLTGSLRLALGDASWRNYFVEGYVFVTAIYFLAGFAMSHYSRWLERRLSGGVRPQTYLL